MATDDHVSKIGLGRLVRSIPDEWNRDFRALMAFAACIGVVVLYFAFLLGGVLGLVVAGPVIGWALYQGYKRVWRHTDDCYLVYEHGLRWRRGDDLTTIRWDEVDAISMSSSSVWMWTLYGRCGGKIDVRRINDEFVRRELVQHMEQQIVPGLFDRMVEKWNAGSEVDFGAFKANGIGVQVIGGPRIRWAQLGEYRVTPSGQRAFASSDLLEGWTKDGKRWLKCSLKEMKNFPVFVVALEHKRRESLDSAAEAEGAEEYNVQESVAEPGLEGEAESSVGPGTRGSLLRVFVQTVGTTLVFVFPIVVVHELLAAAPFLSGLSWVLKLPAYLGGAYIGWRLMESGITDSRSVFLWAKWLAGVLPEVLAVTLGAGTFGKVVLAMCLLAGTVGGVGLSRFVLEQTFLGGLPGLLRLLVYGAGALAGLVVAAAVILLVDSWLTGRDPLKSVKFVEELRKRRR